MKLIGMISLPLATRVSGTREDAVQEIGRHLAFDETGAAWLLVERHEALRDAAHLMRISYARWQLVENLPLVREPPLSLLMDRKGP